MLDFSPAVSHQFAASVAYVGKTEAAWSAYYLWIVRILRSDMTSRSASPTTIESAIHFLESRRRGSALSL